MHPVHAIIRYCCRLSESLGTVWGRTTTHQRPNHVVLTPRPRCKFQQHPPPSAELKISFDDAREAGSTATSGGGGVGGWDTAVKPFGVVRATAAVGKKCPPLQLDPLPPKRPDRAMGKPHVVQGPEMMGSRVVGPSVNPRRAKGLSGAPIYQAVACRSAIGAHHPPPGNRVQAARRPCRRRKKLRCPCRAGFRPTCGCLPFARQPPELPCRRPICCKVADRDHACEEAIEFESSASGRCREAPFLFLG
ncbi:hypothetical protein GW17_00026218 [Ensete ventricosum]|nr:hypothetical protein GW17_00026218 [Ensete ventricosum]